MDCLCMMGKDNGSSQRSTLLNKICYANACYRGSLNEVHKYFFLVKFLVHKIALIEFQSEYYGFFFNYNAQTR